MPTNEIILQRVQAGIETVRGAPVAATRKVYARIAPSYDRTLSAIQDTTGTFQARRRPVYSRARPSFSGTDVVTFEDGPWWALLRLKGGVTPTADLGTPPAQTRVYLPTIAADDLASITMEFNEVGNPYESAQVMCNSWTMRFDSDNDTEAGWMMEADFLARDLAINTYTTALADRTTEVVPARGTKVYMDTSSALGTTQRVGWLISGSISGNNNLHYKAFSEDEIYFAANKVGRGEQTFDAQLTVEFDSDVDFARFRSDTPIQLKVRLEREGSIIHSTVRKRMRLDIMGYWSSIGWGDREGNITATFNLMGFYDPTLGGTYREEWVNALAALA